MQTGGRNLTVGEVEASVRSAGFGYIVLPGTTIVQANSHGQKPTPLVFIRVFRDFSAVANSSVIAAADKYFPRAHSKDITLCNVWVSPYTYRGGADKPPLRRSVEAAQRIATALKKRCA
jgi:hypothetical protein